MPAPTATDDTLKANRDQLNRIEGQLDLVLAGDIGIVESQRAILVEVGKLLEEIKRPSTGRLDNTFERIFRAIETLIEVVEKLPDVIIEKQSRW